MFFNWYTLKIQKYFRLFLIIAICILALYFRLEMRAMFPLDGDEASQVSEMQGGFIQFLNNLRAIQCYSYMELDYFLVYPFFKIFSYNKWGLCIPHIILTVLGFYFLYLICKLYFKTNLGYFIAFVVVCFNATLMWHSIEIRRYAILPTLALISFYLSYLVVNQDVKLSTKKKFAISAYFVLLIWSFVYGIIIFFLHFLFSLLCKWRDKDFKIILKNTVKSMIPVLLVAMPFWCYCVFNPNKGVYFGRRNVFEYIPNPIVDIAGFLKSIFGNLVGYKKFYFLLAGIFFPLVIPYKDRFKQMAFLFITVFVPIGMLLLAALKVKYWFIQRQFIWTVPFFALYLGWAWDSAFYYFKDRIKKRGERKRAKDIITGIGQSCKS